MTVLAERRKKSLFRLVMAAVALLIGALVLVGIETRGMRPDLATGPVVPGLSERIAGANRITVTSADASYRIERVERGAERVWVMRDRGDFPVSAAPLARLSEGLEGLQFVRRMTSDPAKLARLGVDDPRQGGRGILVQIEDGRGALLVNLILGVETGGLYVRRPDQNQTWSARGELPPLRDIASWLELTPQTLQPAQIARVEITPAEGGAYILQRPTPEAPEFAIASPAVQALAASTVTATAERITMLSPIDVQTAPAIQGPPRARIRVVSYDGVAIEGELIEADGKVWLKMVARAETPEQEPAALEINTRLSGWAYALSEGEASALTPPLSALLPPRDARMPDFPTGPQ